MTWALPFGTMNLTRDDSEDRVSFWEFFFLLLIFIPMVMLWVFTLSDLAARSDISGLAKGLWAVAIVFLPVIGMLLYFLTRPDGLGTQPATADTAAGITAPPDAASTIDQLGKLADLHKSGALSDDEFTSAKAKLLDQS